MDSGIFFQENVFSIDLVRDKIFSYLPRSDLLNCSFISKKWLSHTRKFLHRHHSCKLKLIVVEPKQLAAALEMLENSSEVLFNGVYLDLDLYLRDFSDRGYVEAYQGSIEEIKIKPLLQDIIRQIPMKFVVSDPSFVSAYRSLEILHFCLDLLPVEQIEDLKIYGRVNEFWNFAFDRSGLARTFLKLKKLDVDMTVTNSASLAKFLINFPVLREWSAEVTDQALACFVEAKKEYLVKSLSFKWDNTIQSNLIRMQKAQVLLRQIKIYVNPQPVVVQLLWILLQTSKSSLQEVEMDFNFFLPFIRSGIYPLKNVKRVRIFDWNEVGENPSEFIRETIRSDVDTRRIFPNAATIEVK